MEMACPIRSVTIPGLSASIELKGLIVVVGPNSSGKTQLLQDMNEVVLGRSRQLVVLSSVQFNGPPKLDEYLALLIKNGALQERGDNKYQKRGFQFGTEEGNSGDFPANHAVNLLRDYSMNTAGKSLSTKIPGQNFLEMFGPLSCSALFLRNRLTLMDICGNFDPKSSPPRTTLQALHWNAGAAEKLQREIASTFKRGLWVDAMGRHGHLVVRVANSPFIPSAEDRLKPETMETYRGVETEGDGIRS